ncbi:hypothetical protein WJX73_000861 [Symbiochloris irregularis]|uniref:Aldehyde dehydrogenase domain-containing protein n=1 Tax=Symbiochloris irregularis TaxID=706552 RepID=A0AAW1NIL2_9CHLO
MQAIGTSSQPLIGAVNSWLSCFKSELVPVVLPTGFQPHAPTAKPELEAALKRLDAHKQDWIKTSNLERAKLLRRCINTTAKASAKACQAAEAAKGSYGTGLGEECLLWVSIVMGLRQYAESLEAGLRPLPTRKRTRGNGQVVVEVFPQRLDAVMFGGARGELWLQPGRPSTQGQTCEAKLKEKMKGSSIALVLGAGNQVPVVMLDILHMLLTEHSVVICKINPANDYIGPYVREAFLPLVELGVLEIVYGGVSEGAFLCEHPSVGLIHLTGATSTYDAIVWGKTPKEEGRQPPCKKHVTAELGCVTPYIIVPAKWTQADMEYYASEIVAGLVNNGAHNCTKVELIVTDAAWPQREEFAEVLRKRLDEEPRRVSWYPGSRERLNHAKQSIPGLRELGQRAESGPQASTSSGPSQSASSGSNVYEPWLLSTGLTPDQANTTHENWMAWGAFPGNKPHDIGSGNCFVHNIHMYDHVQKSVLWMPWRLYPTHFYDTQNKNQHAMAKATMRYAGSPNLLTLSSAAMAGLFA